MSRTIPEFGCAILDELKRAMEDVSGEECEALIRMIGEAKRVFVTGSGRSMLMMRCFAMRLMQMGITAYVAGDTCTPAIDAGDLLIAASGSGKTRMVCSHVETARRVGAKTSCLTLFTDSPAGAACDLAIRIPGTSAKNEQESGFQSIQLVGSAFEQCLLILCDAIAARLARCEDNDRSIMRLHANLE